MYPKHLKYDIVRRILENDDVELLRTIQQLMDLQEATHSQAVPEEPNREAPPATDEAARDLQASIDTVFQPEDKDDPTP
ncbi:MAG TPA: hypothetical protein PKC76_12145 [Saprospiraceae bacterium]|nr:hypothetical protein [Saprospiraceae bacterium]HMP24880.1 hypothetical protein [Saprospiraceae bacterium]